jgi:hypothetical protein
MWMRRPATILRRATVATLACTALGITTLEAPAEAATAYTRSYTLVKEFYSKPLKRCIRATLWGSVSFKFYGSSHGNEYTDVKLKNPTMRASFLAKCGTTRTATIKKVTTTQAWYDHYCHASVSVSGGLPWNLGVGVTPECGTRTVAKRTTTYSGKYRYVTQYNSGYPAYWKGVYELKSNKLSPVCLSGRTTITSYLGARSDSWSTTMTACVKP